MNPLLTIVIPTRESAATLDRCLHALFRSDWLQFQCIVVDDAATEDLGNVAARYEVIYIKTETRIGDARARNLGASKAASPWLMFLDSDCLVHPDTLARIAHFIRSDPVEAAFFGSYDDRPVHPSTISQYRNLLHHYFHQTAPAQAATFWTGCGIVQREVFERMGGFDTTRKGVRDIEFGYRLRQAGFTIMLDRDIQVTHLKRWTLRAMVATDIFTRASPWTELKLRYRPRTLELNTAPSQLLAAGSILLLPCAAVWVVIARSGWIPLLVVLMVFASANRRLGAWFIRKKGWRFTARALPLLILYYYCGLAGFVLGSLTYYQRKLRKRRTGVAS